MAELLIIADDFTGALDTGVPFAAAGISVRVFTGYTKGALAEGGARVLVMNAESRHLPAQAAYDAVYRIASDAKKLGIPHLYKKTDSALRGNLGSELAAVMDALEEDRLVFAPAFPAFGRVTRNGVHFIDGVPVAESVFGADPFEPVPCSSVEGILRVQTAKPVAVHTDPLQAAEGPGIHVYDAQTDEDLKEIAQFASRLPAAGCAALAAALVGQFRTNEKAVVPSSLPGPLMVLCGSRNPVTFRQLETAEAAGFPRIRLSAGQILSFDEEREKTGRQAAEWLRLARERGLCVVDATGPDDSRSLSEAGLRERVAAGLGRIGKALLSAGMKGSLLCTGGDTLLAVMKAAGIRELDPVGEAAPGVVLTRAEYRGSTLTIISKSGGFGSPDLFCSLARGALYEKERC